MGKRTTIEKWIVNLLLKSHNLDVVFKDPECPIEGYEQITGDKIPFSKGNIIIPPDDYDYIFWLGPVMECYPPIYNYGYARKKLDTPRNHEIVFCRL